MSAQERFQALRMSARQIISNKLTMGFIAVSVAYWIAAPFLPTEWRDVVLLTMRAAITAGLALTAATYFEAATRSLLRGDDGSVAQWLSGVVIFCTAMASSSVYSMAWIWAGRPEWMTNHPVLGFILLWQVVGVSLLIKAPDADRPGISLYKARWLIALAFFAAILVAFTAGRVTSKETSFSQVLQPLHPQCATDQPFWGNITSRGARIYHGPDSPYRSMVVPEQCFRTEAEARAAGFRAPG